MMPADIDPSLCTGEPARERLDDGFSPPELRQPPASPADEAPADLGTQSQF